MKRYPSQRITAQAGAGITTANANKHYLATSVATGRAVGLDDLPLWTLSGTTTDLKQTFGELQSVEKAKGSIETKTMIVRASAAYVAGDNGMSITTSAVEGVAKKAAPDGIYSIVGGGQVQIDGSPVNVYKVVKL